MSNYSKAEHAAYMRKWRVNHPLSEQQRLKDNIRSYAGVYKRRGKIAVEPCSKCGADNAQMHHEDYTKRLEVTWLCRPCHLERHSDHSVQLVPLAEPLSFD